MNTTANEQRYTVRKEMGMWEVLHGSRVVSTEFTQSGAELLAKVWNDGRSRPTISEINESLKKEVPA